MTTINEFEKSAIARDINTYKTWDLIQDKQKALPIALKLLKHPNSFTRDIVANCLSDIKSPSVMQAFIDLLQDPSKEVRSTAISYLDSHADRSVLSGLIKNLENSDGMIRQNVALLIGKLGDASKLPQLRNAYNKETDAKVKRDIGLAMAKLGDIQSRENILLPFKKSLLDQQYQAILDLTYIDDKQLAKELKPGLDNRNNAYLISHFEQKPLIYGRVCDATVNLLAQWFPNAFTFKVDRYKKYSDKELNETIVFAKSL